MPSKSKQPPKHPAIPLPTGDPVDLFLCCQALKMAVEQLYGRDLPQMTSDTQRRFEEILAQFNDLDRRVRELEAP